MPLPTSKLVSKFLVYLFLAPVMVFAVSGCASDDATASSGIEAAVDTVGGVETLLYPETSARQLALSLDTVGIIGGALVDDPDYQFDRVSRNGLAGDSAGSLYVLDGAGKRIQRYDAAGVYLASYAGEGEGPGELQRPSSVNLGPGDTLWVPDTSNRRTNLIPLDGGAGRSIPMGDASSRLGGRLDVKSTSFVAAIRSFSFTPDAAEFPPFPLIRFGYDGAGMDTLWTAPAPARDLVTLETGGRSMIMMMSRQFSPSFYWAALSDGRFVVADSPEYLFTLLAPDGGVLRRISREPAARAVTETDKQFVLDEIRRQAEENDSDDEMLRQRLEKTTFEPVIPRITGLHVDEADRIWVGVSVDRPERTDRVDVYDSQGLLLGELRSDPVLPDLFYGGGLAAELIEDEFDVQQVVIQRLAIE
ncbi:MAG: hypothetical protein ABFS14_09690 [Gemmatimonadota bacterium]